MIRTTLATALLALGACNQPSADEVERADLIEVGDAAEDVEGWGDLPTDDPLPPPNVLGIAMTDVPSPGAPLDVVVTNMNPGDQATLLLSTAGIGQGPCPGALGGICVDVLQPRIVGNGVANANGIAQITVNVPATAPVGAQVWFQAAVANGAASDTSGVDTAVVTDCALRFDGALASQAPAGAVTIDPTYFAMNLSGIVDDGAVYDYELDGNGDGISEQYSSALVFTLFDAIGTELCMVQFDASTGVSVNPNAWTTSSGGTLYEAWEITTLDAGWTDCPPLDPAFPVNDPRDLFGGYIYGMGIGDLVDLQADMQAAFGPQWPQVQPGIYGGYISFDLVNADETGYGFGYPMQDCVTVDPALVPMPAANPLPEGFYSVSSYYLNYL